MRLIDIIKENNDIGWNFQMISANPDITIQDMLDNPQFDWHYYCANYKATISDLLKPVPCGSDGKPLWKWDYRILSSKIPADDILAHKDLGWKWRVVSANNTLTFEHVLAHDDVPWDWQTLCDRCPFRVEMYRLNPYKPWNFGRLSWNRGLHIDDVLANLDLKWDWYGISTNKTVTIDHVLKHHWLPWKWERLSAQIPLCDVFKYPGLPWNWDRVAQNRKFSFDDFIRNSHEKLILTSNRGFFKELNMVRIRYIYDNNLLETTMPGSLRGVSPFYNKKEVEKHISWYANISMKDVLANPDIPWNKLHLVLNQHIPPKELIEHRDYFDIDCLRNIFNHCGLTVNDIIALKYVLPENVFNSEIRRYRFFTDEITISDIVRTRTVLPWNFGILPHDMRV